MTQICVSKNLLSRVPYCQRNQPEFCVAVDASVVSQAENLCVRPILREFSTSSGAPDIVSACWGSAGRGEHGNARFAV